MQVNLSEGKTITLRTRYPFRENKDLVPLYRGLDASKPETVIPLAARMVERWDFEGDPADPAAYEELDAIDLWVLHRAINDFWYERVVAQPKNSHGGSIPA